MTAFRVSAYITIVEAVYNHSIVDSMHYTCCQGHHRSLIELQLYELHLQGTLYPRPYSQVQPLNASFKGAEVDEGCCPLKWPSVAEALAAARATAIFLAASRCVVDAVSLLHMFSTLACTLHARFVVLQANLRCGWDLQNIGRGKHRT